MPKETGNSRRLKRNIPRRGTYSLAPKPPTRTKWTIKLREAFRHMAEGLISFFYLFAGPSVITIIINTTQKTCRCLWVGKVRRGKCFSVRAPPVRIFKYHTRKIRAMTERLSSDGCDAVGDDDTRQTTALCKRPFSDLCNAITDLYSYDVVGKLAVKCSARLNIQ